jgi:hypothetical protein
MARSNSPRAHVRRHFVDVMKAIKNTGNAMAELWHGKSTVFETYVMDDGRSNHRQVPRPAEDYPENRPASYDYAVSRIDDMIRGLTILREQMIEERAAVVEGRPSPTRP